MDRCPTTRRTTRSMRWRAYDEPACSTGTCVSGPPRPRITLEATIRPVGKDRYRRLAWPLANPIWCARILASTPARTGPPFGIRCSTLPTTPTCTSATPSRPPASKAARPGHGSTPDQTAAISPMRPAPPPPGDLHHLPQETCTTHVLDQLVQATNEVAVSPISGAVGVYEGVQRSGLAHGVAPGPSGVQPFATGWLPLPAGDPRRCGGTVHSGGPRRSVARRVRQP